MNREPTTAASPSELDRVQTYLEDGLAADTPEDKNYAIRSTLQLLVAISDDNEAGQPGND